MTTAARPKRRAALYRMVMDKHICPYGLKAKHLLLREGFEVEDNWLTTEQATDNSKAEHGVKTTPQVPYSYIYPFAEGLAGVLMIAGALNWLSIPVALLIGSVGAVSVIQAVYCDRRELKRACVGGASNVPLGFVSLTYNLLMIGMGYGWPSRHQALQRPFKPKHGRYSGQN